MTEDDTNLDAALDAEAGTNELRHATTDLLNIPLSEFAEAYPSTVAIVAVAHGQVVCDLVVARSTAFEHYSPVAMDRIHALVKIVASLDPMLVNAFQAELNSILTMNKLLAERDAALEAALAANKTNPQGGQE